MSNLIILNLDRMFQLQTNNKTNVKREMKPKIKQNPWQTMEWHSPSFNWINKLEWYISANGNSIENVWQIFFLSIAKMRIAVEKLLLLLLFRFFMAFCWLFVLILFHPQIKIKEKKKPTNKQTKIERKTFVMLFRIFIDYANAIWKWSDSVKNIFFHYFFYSFYEMRKTCELWCQRNG